VAGKSEEDSRLFSVRTAAKLEITVCHNKVWGRLKTGTTGVSSPQNSKGRCAENTCLHLYQCAVNFNTKINRDHRCSMGSPYVCYGYSRRKGWRCRAWKPFYLQTYWQFDSCIYSPPKHPLHMHPTPPPTLKRKIRILKDILNGLIWSRSKYLIKFL
jgi:hypothetical protein